MKRLILPLLALIPALSGAPLMASNLMVEGQVESPGEYAWRDGLRLLDLTTSAGVSVNSWPLGAALLRESAEPDQRKLKAGVLFDLGTARVKAATIGDNSLTDLLSDLQEQVLRMPTTGRIQAEMNPLKQRLARYNPLLEPGDHLVYPANPGTIKVIGAVTATCTLDFVSGLRPQRYIDQCPRHWVANPDEIYLIQPDGAVTRLGVASWNSEDAWLAEGGMIYVPLRAALFSDSGNTFNNEMAALLATQYTGVEASADHE
ncbi:capsule biosynthesis GfcC family protein [Halopseudomonas aestusnigri]|uniref:Capsule biosynthesis GfcC n=1 Tax=Halopseudomonas aestusnigri TaxID=857252 RepID=A0AAQ1G555_9GAMM|nr:capsule biosynthesis GfcC family protein [Halopseudomonas aestusnigri]OWL91314.1 hypothetical protein B7O88_03210 [Halopseudomonas aestusnigri]SEF67584.1 Capsule biosynthesis GfcC [Halopseudomonas aestusnigri]